MQELGCKAEFRKILKVNLLELKKNIRSWDHHLCAYIELNYLISLLGII